jgi:Flp pilus assembly protein TadB
VKAPSRALTTAAVGFLLLDAVLFALAAITFHRLLLLLPAAVCAAAGGFVVLAWRRYRRTLVELEDARREMKREVEALRDLLHSKNISN